MDVVVVAAGAPDDLDPPAVVADVVAAAGGGDPQRLAFGEAGGAQRGGGEAGAEAAADREVVGDRAEVAGEAEDVIGDVARDGAARSGWCPVVRTSSRPAIPATPSTNAISSGRIGWPGALASGATVTRPRAPGQRQRPRARGRVRGGVGAVGDAERGRGLSPGGARVAGREGERWSGGAPRRVAGCGRASRRSRSGGPGSRRRCRRPGTGRASRTGSATGRRACRARSAAGRRRSCTSAARRR